jgi:hypothetical protein
VVEVNFSSRRPKKEVIQRVEGSQQMWMVQGDKEWNGTLLEKCLGGRATTEG